MNIQNHESRGKSSIVMPELHDNLSGTNSDLMNALQRAAMLARKGELSQAEDILTPLIESNIPTVEVIDLLARIYAQQGKIDQAQALWLKALELDPSDLHILSALRLCAYYTKPKYEHFLFRYSWLLILILIWFIIVLSVIAALNI